MKSCNWNKEDF